MLEERTIPEIVPSRRLQGRLMLVAATAGTGPYDFSTVEAESLEVDFEGVVGERHRGFTRPADSRVPYLKRGTPMRNTRHLSIVSGDDLAVIAQRLAIAAVDARWLGANLQLDGVPRLSFLPRGTKLLIDGGAILQVEDQNAPCRFAGKVVQQHCAGRDDIELAFAKVARGLRGIVASVERPGEIHSGAAVELRLPEQWIYR